MATPGFRTCRWWHVFSSGTACSGLSRSVVTVHDLMRGLARDLGMGPAMGLDGAGASPRLGSQAMAKLLSSVSKPAASARSCAWAQ